MKRRLYIITLLFFIGFTFGFTTDAEEYKLKAAFIYNFTMYLEWQPPYIENEFIIGVVESSPIDKYLEEIAKTEKVNGKKINIKKFDDLDDLSFCHILFIPKDCTLLLEEIIIQPELRRTLTICEKDEFAKKGAAINFIEKDHKLKFEVNINTLESAGIKASSQLLKLAIVIN